MFRVLSAFRGGWIQKNNRNGAGETESTALGAPRAISTECISALRPLIALENALGAESLFGARFPTGSCRGLVTGNEARGVSQALSSKVDRTVEIPVTSRSVNTLNVAAAAAVGLYAVTSGGFRKAQFRGGPEANRPELIIVGGTDEFEVGSTIRSAAAFG
jgi:SpoU rRNA Methylase family